MRLRTLALVSALSAFGCSGGGDSSSTAPTTPIPAEIGSIDVVVAPSSVIVGGSATATATVRSTTGAVLADRTVTWSSSSTSVATVSGDGRIATLSLGSATISASAGGRSGSATLTVTPVPAASVTISPAIAEIIAGQTQQLAATVRDANGNVLSGRSVEWTSSNTVVATVSSAGVVAALGVGTTTITATSEGRSGTATVTVVPVPVASVVLSPGTAQLFIGGTQQLSAAVRDAGGNALTDRAVNWSSSNVGVASVSASGLVTALGVGTATITATSEGRSGTATVTVALVPVASVTVALGASTLNIGLTTTATATLRDASGAILTGRDVTWSSSNVGVATVSPSGLVTAMAAGNTTITASSEGRSGSASLTVQVAVASVTLVGARRVKVGDSYTYTVEPRDASGNILSLPAQFRVADAAAGSMTSAGTLVPQRAGSITVIVSVGGNDWTTTISAYDWVVSPERIFLQSDERVSNRFGTSDYINMVVSCTSNGFLFVWVWVPHFVTANGQVAYAIDGSSIISQTWDEVSSFDALFFPGNNTLSRNLASAIATGRVFDFAFGEFRGSARAASFRTTGLSALLPPLFARCPNPMPPNGDAIAAARDVTKALQASGIVSSAEQAQVVAERAEAGPQTGVAPSAALRAAAKVPDRTPMARDKR